MNNLLNKWYFSLILIPILVNYLTDFVSLPNILGNWQITLISTLTLVVFILLLEFRIFKKSLQVNENDREILVSLLELLNVNLFQKEIFEQDGHNGYLRESIQNVLDFIEKSQLLLNKTTDKKLNKLIDNLTEGLVEFTSYSSTQLYSDNKLYYTPDKSTELGNKRIKVAGPIMNKLTDEAYMHLQKLNEITRKDYSLAEAGPY